MSVGGYDQVYCISPNGILRSKTKTNLTVAQLKKKKMYGN